MQDSSISGATSVPAGSSLRWGCSAVGAVIGDVTCRRRLLLLFSSRRFDGKVAIEVLELPLLRLSHLTKVKISVVKVVMVKAPALRCMTRRFLL